MATSDSLLPTPTSRDYKGATTKNRQGSPGLQNVLTSSLEASPASHLVQLALDVERPTTAISGRKCLELFKLRNPNGSSLKTCVASLLGQKVWYSSKCALTWKMKVTKSNRLLFQLVPSTRRTDEIVSGLLPTVEAKNHEGYHNSHGKQIPKIGRAVGLLPTPDAFEGSRGRPLRYDPKCKSQSGRTVSAIVGRGTGKKLRLQPAMVQWMMGFPESWTELPLAPQGGEKKA